MSGLPDSIARAEQRALVRILAEEMRSPLRLTRDGHEARQDAADLGLWPAYRRAEAEARRIVDAEVEAGVVQ